MGTKMNKSAFQKMIDENLEWLNKQPRTLERDHIEMILKESINYYYPTPKPVEKTPLQSEGEKKQLNEVSEEDAKKIIKAGYPSFFINGRWKLVDNSEEMGEPCMMLHSKTKAYDFTFYKDDISIYLQDNDIGVDRTNFDTKIECFVEAYNLGYNVTKLSKLKSKQSDVADQEEELNIPEGDIKGFSMFVLKIANSVSKKEMMSKKEAEILVNDLWKKYKFNIPVPQPTK